MNSNKVQDQCCQYRKRQRLFYLSIPTFFLIGATTGLIAAMLGIPWVFYALQAPRLWPLLLLQTMSSFSGVLIAISTLHHRGSGVIHSLGSACTVARRAGVMPNNSFKPNPLRGFGAPDKYLASPTSEPIRCGSA